MADAVTLVPKGDAQSLIGVLTEYLQRAKTGEFDTMAAAFLCKDGSVETVVLPTEHLHATIGAMERLKFDLLRDAG